MVAHPYMHWLIERRVRPSFRQKAALAGILWTATSVVMLNVSQPVHSWLFWTSSLIIVLITFVGSLAAAVLLTASELQSERHQLLKLSNLSDNMLVWSCVLNALHHIRMLLAIAIGLSPAMVIGWGTYLAASNGAQWCSYNFETCQPVGFRFAPLQMAGLLMLSATAAAAILSMTMTCIAVGISMMLRCRSAALALGAVSMIVAIGLIPLSFFFVLYLGTSLHSLLSREGWLSFCVVSLTATVMAVAPYPVIGDASLKAAEPWVWHSSERFQYSCKIPAHR